MAQILPFPHVWHLPKSVEYRWEIFRIAARNIYIGNVIACDEDDAIKAAIKTIPVTNPEHQKRLVARRVDGPGA